MTPEARPEVATQTEHLVTPVLRHHNILSIHPPVPLSEGEVVPAVFTIDVGDKIHLAIPLGAFALSLLRVHSRPGRTDAASLGIGVGALAVWRAPMVIRAIGEAEARRRGN